MTNNNSSQVINCDLWTKVVISQHKLLETRCECSSLDLTICPGDAVVFFVNQPAPFLSHSEAA